MANKACPNSKNAGPESRNLSLFMRPRFRLQIILETFQAHAILRRQYNTEIEPKLTDFWNSHAIVLFGERGPLPKKAVRSTLGSHHDHRPLIVGIPSTPASIAPFEVQWSLLSLPPPSLGGPSQSINNHDGKSEQFGTFAIKLTRLSTKLAHLPSIAGPTIPVATPSVSSSTSFIKNLVKHDPSQVV
ncbi:hypothetical protein BD410DRAFT_808808 [Rickenella mellea]|uniref:Uncharacterized protein n=1 Tax=Rickenella mellea TaxID=50990 RepID=A0A4Y7PMA6_9AGAM|nr:hypothetical protein BD410DRAFT_808808 [Rickenella mellea]